MNSSSPPVRRRRPGSRPVLRQPTNIAPANPQRIVSAGRAEGPLEYTERANVPRTTSNAVGSGGPSQGMPHQQRNARVPDSMATNSSNRATLDAADRKNDGDSILVKSMKGVLPPQEYQKKLESLAISKNILTSENKGMPENTFELSEHDPDSDVFDHHGEYFLKVDNSIVFSPCSPPYSFARSSSGRFGCFKAVIRIQNTSKFNMSYLVQSSSLKMFQISESIGYVCPESTKEVIINTNPKHHLKYEDVAGSFFSISGYPVLFRSQLTREKLGALWNALFCRVLSRKNVEHHTVKWVYPESDSMLDGYSILDRIQFLTPLYGNGNPTKIDRVLFPAISAMEFRSVWIGDKTRDELLMLNFKLCQLERSSRQFEIRCENNQEVNRQINVIGGLIMVTYYFLGCMIYFGFFKQEQPKLELPWYEDTYNTCVNKAGYIYETITSMISNSFKSLYAMIFT